MTLIYTDQQVAAAVAATERQRKKKLESLLATADNLANAARILMAEKGMSASLPYPTPFLFCSQKQSVSYCSLLLYTILIGWSYVYSKLHFLLSFSITI